MTELLAEYKQKVDNLFIASEIAKAKYKEAKLKSIEAKNRLLSTQKASAIVQTVAQSIQEQIHSAISSVVSRCLSSVFETPYKFKILFEKKRGRTEAKMVFEREGKQVDPMTASGGGVVDVASFALRLACLSLKKPALRKVIILDEPFKSPSPHYREKIKSLIEVLSKEMSIQFIIVTNIMELAIGNIIDLSSIQKKRISPAISRIKMRNATR